jgi:hypothetical protein
MTIGLNENSPENHPSKVEPPIVGDFVYLSPDNVYIQFEKDTLIIHCSSIKQMSFNEKDDEGLLELFYEIKGG